MKGAPSCSGNGDFHPATLIMAIQTSLIRDNLEQTLDNSRRMVERSAQRVSRTA